MADDLASHKGIVVGVEPAVVHVQIETLGACGSCAAHSHCGFGEARVRTLDVSITDAQSYQVGDVVEVRIRQSLGLESVLWAYLLPAVLTLVGVLLPLRLGNSEPLAVLCGLLVTIVYYVVLYLFRQRLRRHYKMLIFPTEYKPTEC